MKNLVLMAILAVLAVAGLARAEADKITTTLDLSFVSKYIWRGFDLMDDKASWQPSVNFDFGNGWNVNVFSAWPGASGSSEWSTVNATNFQYALLYKNSVDNGGVKTDYTVGYRFFDYIDMASNDADLQEVFVELAWPEVIGNGVVPHYAYYHMWCSEGNGLARKFGGPIHVMGFDYNWTSECMPELPMKFSWDIVYNDGTGSSTTAAVDHDWSHMTYGLSTAMSCPWTGGTVTPGVWFQKSMDDSVNNEDELYAGLSYSISF